MPRANDVLIHHHTQNDGFDDELDALGTASATSHTHGQRDNGAGANVARTFSDTAGVFGPFLPGEWEAVIFLDATPGNACGCVVKFCQTATSIAADATDDAHVPGDNNTNIGMLRLAFSVTPDKRYISFVATAAKTLRVTFRRLRTR